MSQAATSAGVAGWPSPNRVGRSGRRAAVAALAGPCAEADACWSVRAAGLGQPRAASTPTAASPTQARVIALAGDEAYSSVALHPPGADAVEVILGAGTTGGAQRLERRLHVAGLVGGAAHQDRLA